MRRILVASYVLWATLAATGTNAQSRFKSIDDSVKQGLDAAWAFSEKRDGICENAETDTALAAIQSLSRDEDFARKTASSTAGVRYAAALSEANLTIRFTMADAALAKDCLDLADRLYRGVVTQYTGSSYSGQRDRARLGIDDVRAKRNSSTTSKPKAK